MTSSNLPSISSPRSRRIRPFLGNWGPGQSCRPPTTRLASPAVSGTPYPSGSWTRAGAILEMSMAELFSSICSLMKLRVSMYIHSYRRNRKIANYEISTESLKASKMCATVRILKLGHSVTDRVTQTKCTSHLRNAQFIAGNHIYLILCLCINRTTS